MYKARDGIQSVEVGFTPLDALARAAGPLMARGAAIHLSVDLGHAA